VLLGNRTERMTETHVALEVFGHMRWAVDDMGALFELELATFVRDLLGP